MRHENVRLNSRDLMKRIDKSTGISLVSTRHLQSKILSIDAYKQSIRAYTLLISVRSTRASKLNRPINSNRNTGGRRRFVCIQIHICVRVCGCACVCVSLAWPAGVLEQVAARHPAFAGGQPCPDPLANRPGGWGGHPPTDRPYATLSSWSMPY